jgi:hypothetical protein
VWERLKVESEKVKTFFVKATMNSTSGSTTEAIVVQQISLHISDEIFGAYTSSENDVYGFITGEITDKTWKVTVTPKSHIYWKQLPWESFSSTKVEVTWKPLTGPIKSYWDAYSTPQ